MTYHHSLIRDWIRKYKQYNLMVRFQYTFRVDVSRLKSEGIREEFIHSKHVFTFHIWNEHFLRQ